MSCKFSGFSTSGKICLLWLVSYKVNCVYCIINYNFQNVAEINVTNLSHSGNDVVPATSGVVVGLVLRLKRFKVRYLAIVSVFHVSIFALAQSMRYTQHNRKCSSGPPRNSLGPLCSLALFTSAMPLGILWRMTNPDCHTFSLEAFFQRSAIQR